MGISWSISYTINIVYKNVKYQPGITIVNYCSSDATTNLRVCEKPNNT